MKSYEPPIRPTPIKDRVSVVFVGRGRLDVLDNAFVFIDSERSRTHIPIGSVTCIALEPGTRISHAAVHLAAIVGCLLIWVGEGGVRLYAAGQPGGARSDRLLYQAQLALDPGLRLKVVREMFSIRFGEPAPEKRSVDQLRGLEGARVRAIYKGLAQRHGVPWKNRRYDPDDWDQSDAVNRCLSSSTSCLYGVTEAAILAAGYAPAIGFLHTGKPRSFVYDIADLVKFETVVPIAFRIAAANPREPEREVRRACRDAFREHKTLEKLVPLIDRVLAAGQIKPPAAPQDAQPIAIPEAAPSGDVGHRS